MAARMPSVDDAAPSCLRPNRPFQDSVHTPPPGSLHVDKRVAV